MTRASLKEDGATGSESKTEANEERGAENSEHDKASKEHNRIEPALAGLGVLLKQLKECSRSLVASMLLYISNVFALTQSATSKVSKERSDHGC